MSLMMKGFLHNGIGVLLVSLLLSSCTIMQPFSDTYEIDEAYWQPGETFGRPETLSGSALAQPNANDDDFYSEDAARRNSYAPSYLDSTQSNQTDGMVPVWDPVMGWRMVYDPNAVSSSLWGNSTYNSPWSSPFYSGGWGSSMGYGGYGSNSSWMLGLGMQSAPYFGNGLYGSYYPYSTYSPYSMYSPYSIYGSYMPYYGGYNPYGWGGGGFYNPYYWNGNSGIGGVPQDQVTSVPRPSTGVSGSGQSNGVIHRRPKSLGANGISPTRKQTISDVFSTAPPKPAIDGNRERTSKPKVSSPTRPNLPETRPQPAQRPSSKPAERPTQKPQIRQEPSRPAPSNPRPSSSSSPSRSSGNSGSTKSSGKRP